MAKRETKKKEVPVKKDIYESQLKWVLGAMILLAVIAVFIYVYIQTSKKFEYGGLSFEKIKFDKLDLYYSRIPVKNELGNIVAYYNLYLRNDPRKLTDIPVNGTIKLMQTSILSVDSSIEGCTDNGVAGVTIGTFFKAAGVKIIYGSTNESEAKDKQLEYATCNESEKQTVIIIKQSSKNEVVQERNDCYVISFKDCEIIKSVERFIVATSAHGKGFKV